MYQHSFPTRRSSDLPIPFHDAAEIGTRKVIQEHSTIGVVVTTDGTIGEIDRADYVDAETKVVEELKEVGKPFIMVVNSLRPTSQETELLRQELAEQHDKIGRASCRERVGI